MAWLFTECSDIFGLCIRQYVTFALSLMISSLALWSCIKTYRRESRRITFEMVPLIINFLTTFVMFSLYLIVEEFYNTHLVIMSIQMYSYFLLAYAFVILFLKSEVTVKSKHIRIVNAAFIVISIAIILSIIVVTVLSFFQYIECNDEYWVGSLTVFVLEVPIYVVTVVYCSKTNKKIQALSKQIQTDEKSSEHIFQNEDSYIRLKVLQTRLVLITFTVTIVLHIVQLVLYRFVDNESICLKNTNRIMVSDGIQLTIMTIQNFSQLFPHAMIPLIFWYIPNKFNKRANTIYISPRRISKQQSEYENQNQNIKSNVAIRQKLLNNNNASEDRSIS